MSAQDNAVDGNAVSQSAFPVGSKLVRNDTTTPSVDDYANVFGPTAYNITPDVNRNRKYSRLHIPDVLKVRTHLNLFGNSRQATGRVCVWCFYVCVVCFVCISWWGRFRVLY